MTDTWITSDQHFFHANIIKYCNRPFKSVSEMNEMLTNNWNSVVKPDDTIIICGDFALCGSHIEKFDELLLKLNGHKILIKGNHDKRSNRFYTSVIEGTNQKRFILCVQYFSMQGVLFTHRPFDYFDMVEEQINVHGHIHNNLPNCGYDLTVQGRINVSVEVTNYTPINFEQILKIKRGL